MDLSKLSDEDLLALKTGDITKVSTDGLRLLKGETPTGKKVLDFIRPTVETLGAAGGAVLGTPVAPPFGTVAGAGFGYGIATTGMNALEEALGYRKPVSIPQGLVQGATDVAMGATSEAVGRVAVPALTKLFSGPTDIVTGNYAKNKAARIAREALGRDSDEVIVAMRGAPASETAAQATANINSPAWQSLNEVAGTRNPRFYGSGLTVEQTNKATNVLRYLAKGSTQTEMIGTRKNAVEALNKKLIPVLETELNAANTAGVLKPKLEGEASRMAEAAASKVEDVRRFTEAADRASGRAHYTTLGSDGKPVSAVTAVPGYPRQPGRYTYMGELEKKAEQVAAQAANASLPFGEAARFAQSAADSLAAHGLKPLEAGAIQSSILKSASSPEFAGNRDVLKAATRVAEDIVQWTNKGGVIDAYALDAIRKNSVNGVIRELYPAADRNVQKELAASVLTKVKPLVVDAIEKAGGTGYGKYLEDYAAGRHVINQKKMAAVAAELFSRKDKSGFVELVKGNNPEAVTKVFGPGRYDIAKEMDSGSMGKLSGIADLVERTAKSGEQASLGRNALAEIIKDNTFKFKIPFGLSLKTGVVNKALDMAESRLSGKTMNILAEALKSGASGNELLTFLPAKERVALLRVLSDNSLYQGTGALIAPHTPKDMALEDR